MRNKEVQFHRQDWVSSRDPYHNSHVRIYRRFEAKTRRDLEYAASLTELKDPEDVIQQFADHMQKPNTAGLVIANHDQHVNIAAFLKTLRDVNDKSPIKQAHQLIVTMSLMNGDQGAGFQAFAWGMKPLLAENGMDIVEVMRDKDREKFYKPNGAKSAEELRKDTYQSARNITALRKAFSRGDVVWLFPAGTTTEGTVNPETREDYGMQPLDNKLFHMFIEYAAHQGLDLKVLPLGLNGFNNIAKAREDHATRRTRLTIAKNMTYGKLTGHEYLAEIVPGHLFGIDDFKSANIDTEDCLAVNDYGMRQIAKNVEPKRRGVFA